MPRFRVGSIKPLRRGRAIPPAGRPRLDLNATPMPERQAPAPLLRRGPRPLALHLALAMLRSSISIAASRNWSSVSPQWSESAKASARRIVAALRAGPARLAEDFPAAVLQEALAQDRELLAGIAAYRRHPFVRDVPEVPARWQEGGSRLLDYGPEQQGADRSVLVVPSLVNRAYVLDLLKGHSMLRFLAASGVRTYLLDWGWPEALEREFTLTDYIAGRLERALMAIQTPVVLIGYCMGGLLALAAALRRPDRVRALALLATPWDFHAGNAAQAHAVASLLPIFEPALQFWHALPVDFLQSLFALLDPFGVAGKYRAFARLPQHSFRAQLFVALEDWLNDGVPLAAPVARETLWGWYGQNTPVRGEWRVAGLAVRPQQLAMPALVVTPVRDRIVPPESARPLAEALPQARLLLAEAGHIGMVAGSTAKHALWQPLLAWLEQVFTGVEKTTRARTKGGVSPGEKSP